MGIRRVSQAVCGQVHAVDHSDRLSRDGDRFKDEDLAKILQGATNQVAGAFKARGIPERMRVVEVLGIMQSRAWGTCSVRPDFHGSLF